MWRLHHFLGVSSTGTPNTTLTSSSSSDPLSTPTISDKGASQTILHLRSSSAARSWTYCKLVEDARTHLRVTRVRAFLRWLPEVSSSPSSSEQYSMLCVRCPNQRTSPKLSNAAPYFSAKAWRSSLSDVSRKHCWASAASLSSMRNELPLKTMRECDNRDQGQCGSRRAFLRHGASDRDDLLFNFFAANDADTADWKESFAYFPAVRTPSTARVVISTTPTAGFIATPTNPRAVALATSIASSPREIDLYGSTTIPVTPSKMPPPKSWAPLTTSAATLECFWTLSAKVVELPEAPRALFASWARLVALLVW
mmetsp:Transcript_3735/g.10634  ORF Transcript_3735/g.10634 Transcript_3735/m.10634 type:complete len:311 (+) Transcript_3735:488-1420(+)